MSRKLKLILGPPGTGKTTTLINKVKGHLEQGVAPGRIAFVSFTKKAAMEAADRACSVLKLSRSDLTNFRTLHSLAFQSLGIRRGEVMGRNDYLEIASLLGVEFRGYADMSDGVYCATEGDIMLHMVGLAHAKVQELRDVWEYINPDFDWFKLKQFNDTMEQYKIDTAKIDFNDMIKQYTSQRLLCDVDVAIVDEAQDLSNAQWDMVKVAFRGAKHVYLAGDDDQCIYAWSGANIERFLQLSTDREVLPLTYRLPKQIMEVTEGIAARIKKRFPKSYRSMNPGPGVVHHVNVVDMVKITSGSWFLLARNAMHLDDYKQLCREQGVGFTDKRGISVDNDHLKAIKAWIRLQQGGEISEAMHSLIHMLTKSKKIETSLEWYDALKGIPARDREYYQSILRAGNRLDDCGRIYIGTIHSVKGGEADHVVLKQDVTWNTARGFDTNPDAEHRVFYVGASRARQSLHIIAPQGEEAYII